MGESLAKWYEPGIVEAGCDEAGRGCLAGPVVAAAVILPEDFEHPWLNDSKALSEKQRDTLRPIIEKEAIAWGVGICSVEEIDKLNILKASFLAMHKAIRQLSVKPESLLIDGNRFVAFPDIPHHCMVKGDARFRSIAAASILAKTHRDALMLNLDAGFPDYQWKKNKGYPTKVHREAIRQVGPSPHHRKSFRLLPQQGKLF